MLIQQLQVTLADLMPLEGRVLHIAGDGLSFRLSDRLVEAIAAEAQSRAVTSSAILRLLLNEIHEHGISNA